MLQEEAGALAEIQTLQHVGRRSERGGDPRRRPVAEQFAGRHEQLHMKEVDQPGGECLAGEEVLQLPVQVVGHVITQETTTVPGSGPSFPPPSRGGEVSPGRAPGAVVGVGRTRAGTTPPLDYRRLHVKERRAIVPSRPTSSTR